MILYQNMYHFVPHMILYRNMYHSVSHMILYLNMCHSVPHMILFRNMYILLLLLIKEVGSARLRERDIQTISPKIPAPQYQPINRKKRKGKIVEDYSRDRAT